MAKRERKIEYKDLELEVKEFAEVGGLTGYLSTFGNLDLGGDIVLPGAFTKTLKDRPVNPLLWHHDPSEPAKVIGSFEATEDAKGLFINADFLPDPDSQNIRTKLMALKAKGVKIGLSIGYQIIRFAWDRVKGDAVRLLQELKLNEGSVTLSPMNEQALVTGVKSDEVDTALAGEPDRSTPAGEPQDDTSTPETDGLHLLDEGLEITKSIANLIRRSV
jgi:hypothetical protein